MDPERTPVVVAAAQLTERDREVGAGELLAQIAEAALSAAPALREAIERVSVVNILARSGGPAPASSLVSSLGLSGVIRAEKTTVGGCTPQWLIGRAAEDIAAGRLQATLIAGAEAVRSGRLRGTGDSPARREPGDGPRGGDEVPAPEPDQVIGDDRLGSSDEEIAAGLFVPVYVYPLFESALAAREGRSPDEQRRVAASVMAPFTAVAARRSDAWFPVERTADEIATAGPENRLVAEPYTKLMTAFLGGSQAAAVVVTSLAVAASLGLAGDAMFVRSSAVADEVWFPSARPDLGSSAAAALATRAALDASGLDLDEIDLIDLYSCFPCAVQMAAAAAGLALDDRRGLTVTGGLPYFGGPGNNYVTHSVATIFERLREQGGSAIATGVSWFMTKLSAGIYSSDPGPSGFAPADTNAGQVQISASALPVVRRGETLPPQTAVVDAGTVIYGRDGEVTSAPVVATLGDQRRVVAMAHRDELAGLAGVSLVGEKIEVAGDPAVFRTR